MTSDAGNASQGDEEAFRALFDRYQARLFQYIFKIIKSKEAAEEITMDVFLKLWLSRDMLPQIQVIDRKKETGYDLMSSSSSVSSLSSFNDHAISRQLTIKEQGVVVKTTQYCIAHNFTQFTIATKKNLWEMFPNCITQIKRFCQSNKINYNRQQDLEAIVDFLGRSCVQKSAL